MGKRDYLVKDFKLMMKEWKLMVLDSDGLSWGVISG
jgi:hypothetical protein